MAFSSFPVCKVPGLQAILERDEVLHFVAFGSVVDGSGAVKRGIAPPGHGGA
jgi:hypothetical protein